MDSREKTNIFSIKISDHGFQEIKKEKQEKRWTNENNSKKPNYFLQRKNPVFGDDPEQLT